MLSRSPKLLFLLLLLAVVGCISLPSARDQRAGAGEQPTPLPTSAAPARPTYTVERGNVVYQLAFSGRVTSAVQSKLAFAVEGVVKTVNVRREDSVQAGDVLAELDTQPLEVALQTAQAQLAIAQTRLDTAVLQSTTTRRLAEIAVEQAQLDLDFARQQAAEAPTSEQTYQIAKLELTLEAAELALNQINTAVDPILQADVDEAALQISILQEAIANSQLIAPFDGQILSFNLAVGQSVAPGTAVGILVDPTQLEVSAPIQTSLREDLAEEMTVSIVSASGPGNSTTGTVRHVPLANEGDTPIRISFDDPEQANFELGDRVGLTIVIAQHEDTLWLPPAAVREFNGRLFVVIQDGDAQRRADITVGLVGEDRVELLAGVAEGDVVVGP